MLRHLLTVDDGCGADSEHDDTDDVHTSSSSLRVCAVLHAGGSSHGYVQGEVLTFDDSFLHEVTSNGSSTEKRVLLVVETLNPLVCDVAASRTPEVCRDLWWRPL